MVASSFSRLVPHAVPQPDLERMRQIIDEMVPFNGFVGVRIAEMNAERGVAQLPDCREMTNHMGTVHAGALFLAAEVAAAVAFVAAVAPRLVDVEHLVLRDARTMFRRPAHGQVTAIATVDREATRAIVDRNAGARIDVDAKAVLYDANGTLVVKVFLDYLCMLTTR